MSHRRKSASTSGDAPFSTGCPRSVFVPGKMQEKHHCAGDEQTRKTVDNPFHHLGKELALPMSIRADMLLSGVAASLFLASGVARADASCTEVFDAGVREVETPHHIHYTSSGNSKGSRTFESVFDGTAIYSNATGVWKKSNTARDVMQQNAREERQKLDAVCTRVGNESIDGQSATRWHMVPGEESGGDESDVWLNGSGMPVHQRMVLAGEGTWDVRIDYADVKAPIS
jgi:hypothetical protein